jgi:hypothetical protein
VCEGNQEKLPFLARSLLVHFRELLHRISKDSLLVKICLGELLLNSAWKLIENHIQRALPNCHSSFFNLTEINLSIQSVHFAPVVIVFVFHQMLPLQNWSSENNTIVVFYSILGFGCAIPGAWPKTVSYLFTDEYLAGSLGGIVCSRY